MSWYETFTSTPVILAGLLGISAAVYAKRQSVTHPGTMQPIEQAKEAIQAVTQAGDGTAKMAQASASIMSPPSTELAPPKDDPISPNDLAQYNGLDPEKPIYIAIKGRVFDVTAKREMYGKDKGYNVFAGKDASKGLGMSSLDPKDAVPDYKSLNEAQMRTLDQWESFFEKRYSIVGKVSE